MDFSTTCSFLNHPNIAMRLRIRLSRDFFFLLYSGTFSPAVTTCFRVKRPVSYFSLKSSAISGVTLAGPPALGGKTPAGELPQRFQVSLNPSSAASRQFPFPQPEVTLCNFPIDVDRIGSRGTKKFRE